MASTIIDLGGTTAKVGPAAEPGKRKIQSSGKSKIQSSESDFDPLREIYSALDERPSNLLGIDFQSLSPQERTCLVIDGTITRFLEAQAKERIEVIGSSHTNEKLRRDHKWLELRKGSPVLSRRVLLVGNQTGTVHASAATLLVADRVAEAVGGGISRIPEGIGRMLAKGRVEQYRELLWCGIEPPTDLPGEMRTIATDYCLTRTYRIIVNRKPIMMITEWFQHDGSGITKK